MSNLPMHQRRAARNTNTTTTNGDMRRPYDIEGGGGGGGGRGGGGVGRLSANDANANILEQQNNERMNELSAHVARLKNLTIDIGNEVREQNSLLDTMGDGFQNTRDLLIGSLGRIGTMLESGGAKHMCYMVAFCVFIMIFLWWLMSHKGTHGA